MVLNTPVSHKLSTYFYNTIVCKDPSDYRSSRPDVFCKKGVLKNFVKFTGKHLCQALFFSKVAGLRPVQLYQKETLALVFSCETCVKFLRTPFSIEHLWWLLL